MIMNGWMNDTLAFSRNIICGFSVRFLLLCIFSLTCHHRLTVTKTRSLHLIHSQILHMLKRQRTKCGIWLLRKSRMMESNAWFALHWRGDKILGRFLADLKRVLQSLARGPLWISWELFSWHLSQSYVFLSCISILANPLSSHVCL